MGFEGCKEEADGVCPISASPEKGQSWLQQEGPKPEGTDYSLSLFARPSAPPVLEDDRRMDVRAALQATDARTDKDLDGQSKADVETLDM